MRLVLRRPLQAHKHRAPRGGVVARQGVVLVHQVVHAHHQLVVARQLGAGRQVEHGVAPQYSAAGVVVVIDNNIITTIKAMERMVAAVFANLNLEDIAVIAAPKTAATIVGIKETKKILMNQIM